MKNKKYMHTVGNMTAEIEIAETENNPHLVPLDKKKHLQAVQAEYFAVRKAVAEKLDTALQFLPQGYQFKIFETYRSYEKQLAFWHKEVAKIQKNNPNMAMETIEELANQGIANPYKIGSGHQTGGAVDITLVYQGKELDMGTKYLETNHPHTITDSPHLTPEQKANRQLLKSVMEKVGMVNYPLEWWHYSYGEHEWAVLTKHKSTLYALLKKPFQKEKN